MYYLAYPITTNKYEGWNRGSNDSFNTSHPTLNTLVKELINRVFLFPAGIIKDIINRKQGYILLSLENHSPQ
jgi:hypothetical protein